MAYLITINSLATIPTNNHMFKQIDLKGFLYVTVICYWDISMLIHLSHFGI